ncbi:MAG: hypothetical protein PVI52_03800 [Chromatiales bacterium]|jgi:hypothetical protein
MKRLLNIVIAITGICALNVHADATLTFVLDGPEMEPKTKTLSLSRFFIRIDDTSQPNDFLLFQAGKFFPLYQVDQEARTYTLLTPEVKPTLHAGIKPQATQTEPSAADSQKTSTDDAVTDSSVDSAAKQQTPHNETTPAASDGPAHESGQSTSPDTETSPGTIHQKATAQAQADAADPAALPTQSTPKTTLHLTGKSQEIGGVNCRVVEELLDNKPIIKHCMADKARLGITEREMRSLARTFEMARERDLGWLGTATKDERFVSIASEDLGNQNTLVLQSVSTKPLPASYLRIPREFTKIPQQ